MILVDTNVVSEPVRPLGLPAIARWLDREDPAGRLFMASTSLVERLSGVTRIPRASAGSILKRSWNSNCAAVSGAVLAFEEAVARARASIMERSKGCGVASSMADAQIAAVAEIDSMIVATRYGTPFRNIGPRVINPWDDI